MEKRESLRSGATLVETLVSLVIVLLVLISFYTFSIFILKSKRKSLEREDAFLKAQILINYLQALDYDDSCLNVGTHSCKNNDCCFSFKNDTAVSYKVQTKSSGLKEICVESRYNSNKVKLCILKGKE